MTPCDSWVRRVKRLYYVCRVRLDDSDGFVVWYQSEQSGFVRTAGDQLLVAKSLDQLVAAACGCGITLASREVTSYDFDRLAAWCERPREDDIDCVAFLNAWNFVDDLARTEDFPDTPFAVLNREAAHCYDKLFWGNNISAVMPPGEKYIPSWTPDDVRLLQEVLRAGVELLKREVA